MNTTTLSRPVAEPEVAAPAGVASLIANVRATWTAFGAVSRLSDAVALGRDPTDEEDAVWEAANERFNTAATELLSYTPADLQELAAIIEFVGEGDTFYGLADPRTLADMVRRVNTDRSEREAPWTAAVDAYRAADADLTAIDTLSDIYTARQDEAAPMPAILGEPDGGVWGTEREINNSARLNFDKKAEMIAALRSWRAAQADFQATYHYDPAHFEKAVEALDEARNDAEHALLLTPAPTLNALADKLRILITRNVCAFQGEHADDPGFAQRMVSESTWAEGDMLLFRAYQDVLRLSGQQSPALDAEAFDASAWVAAFRSLPGHDVDEQCGPVYYDAAFPRSHGPAPARPEGMALWAGLTNWQKKMVKAVARRDQSSTGAA